MPTRTASKTAAFRVSAAGTKKARRTPAKQLRTERDILKAARGDPDAQPLTSARLRSMKPVPRTKTMRLALRMSQPEFAARYRIPIGTLRDWEQGRSEPDQTARVLLHLIANDPDGVARSIAKAVPRHGQRKG